MRNDALLAKAISSGKLAEVKALLDSGVAVESDDDHGEPGLALGLACSLGFVDIVRELVRRGARVNFPDNSAPTSPLSMAIRHGKREVTRTLIELGATPPPGMNTGLSPEEVSRAQEKTSGKNSGLTLDPVLSDWLSDFEEITIEGRTGVDTQILEDEILRDARR